MSPFGQTNPIQRIADTYGVTWLEVAAVMEVEMTIRGMSGTRKIRAREQCDRNVSTYDAATYVRWTHRQFEVKMQIVNACALVYADMIRLADEDKNVHRTAEQSDSLFADVTLN